MPGPDDSSSIIDQAINGASATPAATPPAGPPSTGGNDMLSLLVAAKGSAARVETLDPTVSSTDPLTGAKTSSPNRQPTYRYWWPDGTYADIVALDTGSVLKGGTAIKALNPSSTTPKANPQAGTNTNDQYIVTQKPDGSFVSTPNPNYVPPAPKTADEKPFFIPGPGGQGLVPATAAEYTAYANSAAKDQANQTAQARLQSQIQSQTDQMTLAQLRDNLLLLQAQGKIDDAKAAEMFKEKYDQMTFDAAQKQLAYTNANQDLLTQNTLQNSAFNQQATQQANAFQQQNALMQTGLTAGNDAVAAAQAGLNSAVGPGFGANFAAGLTAAAQGNPAGVKYGAGDFTTPMPNFQALASQATAQAIAHLSPYAASMVGRPPPMAGYLPGGMPPTGPLLPQPTSQYLPPNNEAGAAMAGAPVGGMPLPPYAPQVNRAVGANAQIQAGVR